MLAVCHAAEMEKKLGLLVDIGEYEYPTLLFAQLVATLHKSFLPFGVHVLCRTEEY